MFVAHRNQGVNPQFAERSDPSSVSTPLVTLARHDWSGGPDIMRHGDKQISSALNRVPHFVT